MLCNRQPANCGADTVPRAEYMRWWILEIWLSRRSIYFGQYRQNG
jgi:hypothetical protein